LSYRERQPELLLKKLLCGKFALMQTKPLTPAGGASNVLGEKDIDRDIDSEGDRE